MTGITSAHAQTPELTSALNYLSSSQNPDGSWGGEASLMPSLPSTVSVLNAYKAMSQADAPSYQPALSWLQSQSLNTTDYLSERILILTGQNDTNTLLSYFDYGWGGYAGYDTNILDTALALHALKSVSYTGTNIITPAISRLISSQNSDGGWAFRPSTCSGCNDSDQSNVYMTAIVSRALQQFPQSTSTATAINKATSYLKAHQNPDGGFGTVYGTSLAYMALAGVTTDGTVLGSAINYLKSAQGANGSWLDDPYQTALAVSALSFSENYTPPPPPPTTGAVKGKVVDASTGQPLGGVSVVISGTSFIVVTDSTGAFSLADIPQGSYQIQFSIIGYTSSAASVTVTAGSIKDIGNVSLKSTTGIIKGTITGANGPLEGALITVTGTFVGSTLTGADGSFIITGVAPGGVTITVSKAGYTPATGVGTVSAGGVLFFNPLLQTAPPDSPTTGTVTGKAVDAQTGLPLGGVSVVLQTDPTINAQTNSAGDFTLTNILEGSHALSLALSGYGAADVTVNVKAGVIVGLGSIPLSANPTTGIIKGTVEDGSGTALEGVLITITGSFSGSTLTGADGATGTFIFDNVTPGEITLTASKTGYNTVSGTGTVVAGGVQFFSIRMGQEPLVGSLKGAVYDGTANKAIPGAVVTLSGGITVITDAGGGFLKEGLTPGTYVADVTASGYDAQKYQVMVSAGGVTDMGTINLIPTLSSSTITGKVTDASTGGPIAGATVTVGGTGLSAVTSGAGTFSITGIEALEFVVKASAPGYDTGEYKLVTGSYGTYNIGLTLNASGTGDIRITSLTTDAVSYPANAEVAVNAVIENAKSENIDVELTIKLPHGNEDYICTKTITLVPGQNSHQFTLNTSNWPPGEYSLEVSIKKGYLLAVKSRTFNVITTKGMMAAIEMNPPVTLIDLNESVTFAADIINTGNISLHGNIALSVSLNGEAIYSKSAYLDANIGEMRRVEFGSFLPAAGGNYDVEVSLSDPEIASIKRTLYVGEHITGTFSLLPFEAASGTAATNGLITLRGFASADNVTEKIANLIIFSRTGTPTGGIYDNTKILSLPPDYLKVELIYAGFDDNGYISVNGNEVFRKYDGCCSAENNFLNIDVTEYFREGKNEIYGLVDDCCGISASIAATFRIYRPGAVRGNLIVVFPDNVVFRGASREPSSVGKDEQGHAKYTWQSVDVDRLGEDLNLELEFPNLEIGEERPSAITAFVEFKNTFTGKTFAVPLDIPSVRGVPPFAIDTNIDKSEYASTKEDVKIDISVVNVDKSFRDAELKVVIEDMSGNEVTVVADTILTSLEPVGLAGQHYRIPLKVTAHHPVTNPLFLREIDFAPILAELGIPGEAVDKNSIRLLEIDMVDGRLSERSLYKERTSPNLFNLKWLIKGNLAKGETREYYIYFKIIENGTYQPLYSKPLYYLDRTMIAFRDYEGIIQTIEYQDDGTFLNLRRFPHCCGGPVMVGDFNKDGYTDVIFGQKVQPYWVLYYVENRGYADENGSLKFMPPLEIGRMTGSLAPWISDMSAGDFNKDGNLDFIVTKTSAKETTAVFLGNGRGQFERINMTPPPGNGFNLSDAADFDEDGYDDIVMGVYQGKLYFYKGKGQGTFEPPVPLLSGDYDSLGIAADDFDSDGLSDIILDTGNGGTLFFKGNGDGTFGAPTTIPSLSGYFIDLASGDLNRDGVSDLVGVEPNANKIYVYLGNGDGTFGRGTAIPATYSFYSFSPVSVEHQSKLRIEVLAPQIIPSRKLSFIWSTGTTFAGDYRVRASLLDAGKVLSEDKASFAILPDIQVSSKLAMNKIAYNPNESLELTSSITSLSRNYIMQNLIAELSIKDNTSKVLYTENYAIKSIVPGQTEEIKTYWNTSNSPKGAYTVTLKVSEGASVLSTSSASFEILGSSKTGQGLVGTINAQTNPVYRGKDETISYTITNTGNEDIDAMTVRVIIIDPDTGTVKAENSDSFLLAKGETVSGINAFSTQTLATKVYLVALLAQTAEMPEPKTLASANFEVKQGIQIKVSKTMPDIKRVLVWLNYSWQSGQKCPGAELMEKALNEAGVIYKIVFDKKNFQGELENPFYTDFLILGDQHPLEDHFSEVLMKQVASGKGLISSLFNRQNLDREVFGIKFIGALSGGDYPVELPESNISKELSFQSTGKSLRVEYLGDGQALGENILGWLIKTTKKGTETYPGIIHNKYGNGDVLYFAFDLGMSTANYEQFAALFANSINYIHSPSDPNYLRPGQMVPIRIEVKSLGGEIDVQIKETVPSNFQIFDSESGQWITERPWTIDTHLEPNFAKTGTYYALTPEQGGTYALTTEIGYFEGGAYNFFQSLSQILLVE